MCSNNFWKFSHDIIVSLLYGKNLDQFILSEEIYLGILLYLLMLYSGILVALL